MYIQRKETSRFDCSPNEQIRYSGNSLKSGLNEKLLQWRTVQKKKEKNDMETNTVA